MVLKQAVWFICLKKKNPLFAKINNAQLRQLIEAHAQKTGSPKAQEIWANFAVYLPQFWQLVPPSEADTPEARSNSLSVGGSQELVGGSTN
jgi:glutamate synthase domain-containing protein 3